MRRPAMALVVLLVALFGAVVTGCATPDPGTEVPRFPRAAAATDSAARPQKVGVLPDDCPYVLSAGDLGAVFGLPLDSVAVRTIIGIPMPASGRTERIDCTYSGTVGNVRGRTLVNIAATAFADREAAQTQWQINADASDGARSDLKVGTATAVVFERRGEAELSIVYGSGTLTLLLPDRPLPGGRSRVDMLTDLARRVLPSMAEAGAAPSPTPKPVPAPTPDQKAAAAGP